MDQQIFFFINSRHNEFFDAFMWMLSQKNVWIPLYAALLYAVWRNYSWKGALSLLVVFGIGMLFTDWGNAHILRPWIGRLRPSNPDNPIAPMVHIVYGRHATGCGMPSAHSANMWLLTFVVCHWLRSRWVYVSMPVVTLLICYSRVYLGFHYPGDILGGFVLAAMVVFGLSFMRPRSLWQVKKPEPLRQVWVPAAVAVLTVSSFLISAAAMTV